MKEVQQITGCLTALSRFLSRVGDKAFLSSAAIKKEERFEWTAGCKEAFTKVNSFLKSLSILTRPKVFAPLSLSYKAGDELSPSPGNR